MVEEGGKRKEFSSDVYLFPDSIDIVRIVGLA